MIAFPCGYARVGRMASAWPAPASESAYAIYSFTSRLQAPTVTNCHPRKTSMPKDLRRYQSVHREAPEDFDWHEFLTREELAKFDKTECSRQG